MPVMTVIALLVLHTGELNWKCMPICEYYSCPCIVKRGDREVLANR